MTPDAILLFVIIIAIPIAWFIAEFKGNLALRVTLGILAIYLTGTSIWLISTIGNRFKYNAWYGGATGDLIDTSLEQIEDGNLDRVLKIWRGLNEQYKPTYENRAHYDELVEEATARIRGDVPIETGSHWDAPLFSEETWLGHWEDGHGYWIVIRKSINSYAVVQSGEGREEIHSLTISPDFGVLSFQTGEKWRHTLTLKNKYEATYEWFDIEKGKVWGRRPAHKLIRASENQKTMTQQVNSVLDK